MSLQVWLPLTKDLRQQGLSNVTITNEGATFESAGKLGGCYNLTGGPITISNLPNPQAISIAFWFKRTANTGTRQFMFTAWSGVTCELTTDGKPTFAVYRNSYPTITGDVITTSTGWVHYCGTFSQTEGMKLYINGSLVASNSNTTAIAWGTTTGQIGKYSSYASMSAQINDFRIYDHCLSEQEIKKISQGLIVHYPLNRNGWGQDNLIPNSTTKVSSGYYVSNWTCTADTSINNWGCTDAYRCTGSGGTNTIIGTLGFGQPSNSNFTYSYSVWVKNNHSINKIAFSINHANYYSEWLNPGQAKRLIVEGAPGNGTSYIQLNWRTNTVGEAFDFSYWRPKIEIGNKVTSWCPNFSDKLATILDFNGTTEYDCSGFNNNGVRINFPQQNLLLGSDFSSQYTNNLVTDPSTDWVKYLRGYNSTTVHTFSNGEDTITLNAAANLGVCFVRKATDINLDPNSYYTLSCEAKSTQTAQPLCIGLSYYNTSNSWIWRGGTNPQSFTTTNTWQKFSLTFKPDADTQYTCYCFTVVGASNGTNTFTIRHCKLEKGSVATAWTLDNVNNWTSDAPKYEISTQFNASYPNYIQIPSSSYALQGAEAMTWSIWAYDDDWTNYSGRIYSCTEGGGVNIESANSGADLNWAVNMYTATDKSTYAYQGYCSISTSTLSPGWHLFTWTYTINGTKVYIDGELKKEVNIVSYGLHFNTSVSLYLGAESSSSSTPSSGYYLTGKLSDFRIYATALSANDIKSLYQNGATVDSDGTIYGQIRN